MTCVAVPLAFASKSGDARSDGQGKKRSRFRDRRHHRAKRQAAIHGVKPDASNWGSRARLSIDRRQLIVRAPYAVQRAVVG